MGTATKKNFRSLLWGTIGLAVGCTLFLSAGFWQLDRAAAKRELFNSFEQNANKTTRRDPLSDDELDGNLYGSFTFAGRYVPDRQILLDNMVHDGRSGYHVLTPLKVENATILVNRGWLPANPDRSVMPDVAITDNMRTVSGRLYRLPRPGYELAPVAPSPDSDWPLRLSFPTADEIARLAGFSVHNYQLLLDPTDTDGYTREWRPALMSPEKHLAYAIQWFAMAATIVIIYVALTIRAARRTNPDG